MLAGRNSRIVLAAALLAAILAACAGSGAGPSPSGVAVLPLRQLGALDGSEWVLASLNGSGLVEGSNITLEVSGETITGFAGCNWYSRALAVEDEAGQKVPEVVVTARLCLSPEGVMEQEAAYVESLKNAAAYRVVEDRLELVRSGGEATLIFTRKEQFPMDPADLVGSEWQLLSLDGSPPIEGSAITLSFPTSSRIDGYAGCRGYTGTYQANGDDINVTFLEMTEIDCLAGEALLEQEGRYTTALSEATDYRLSEGRLELFTAPGGVLLFGPQRDGRNER